jgi:sulfur-oxidizing protein SoxY
VGADRVPGVTDMRANRRTFLQTGLALLGWLGWSRPAHAADRPGQDGAPRAVPGADLDAAFEATTAPEALRRLYGGAPIEPSAAIALTVPSRVDNGANVPVSVATTLQGVRSIALVVEKNPRPLAALYDISAATRPAIGCRIKMAESCTLLAIVDTASGVYRAAAEVTVTQGGCA